MPLDRTGEPVDTIPLPPCGRPGCKGWLGYDDEYRPIPCLKCWPELRKTVRSNDISVSAPSARAQAAIEAAERDDR